LYLLEPGIPGIRISPDRQGRQEDGATSLVDVDKDGDLDWITGCTAFDTDGDARSMWWERDSDWKPRRLRP
jgi:hypothetical protein